MLKILGRTSSINVRKVLWTCMEIGLDYEREDWGTGFRSTQSPEFLALNPNALVPVLIDGDFTLWESNTICRYLAGKHGRVDLLPTEPRARAQVETWMDWTVTDLNSSWRYAFLGLMRKSPEHSDPALVAASARNWNHHMGILDRQLQKTHAFVAGDTFTLADIVLGLSINRWKMTPIERDDLPAIDAYLERLDLRSGYLTHGNGGAA